MEKLQAALEKAREHRGTATPVPPNREKALGATRGNTRSEQSLSWENIPEVALDLQHLLDHRILTSEASTDESAGFDLLRTKIQLQMEKNGWKRLAITSPTKASGKTTVCANVAFALSRQKSKRTIVFEMDMRRPSMAKTYGLNPARSTADLLRGDVELEDQAFRIGPDVAVSCNPQSLVSPSDLFLDPRTTEQLKRIERRFAPDLMIFDLPPIYAGDDATAFFPNVDCVLLVAEAERCTIQQIDKSEREIAEHTNFLGVVLNKCRYPEEQESYGYSYT
ncbi:CpsD/CapB family tyrosine-protein kinase [Tropicimonas sp. S265A]|uniref:CpsD/CapB family tyrosine-protein kinase n=1 Tax=Tropicimonas sp. S265A TaxID=3415134 RepID=UPI003C7C2CD5